MKPWLPGRIAFLLALGLPAVLAASHPFPPSYDMRLLVELRTDIVEAGSTFHGVLRVFRGGATTTESQQLPQGGRCGYREVGLAAATPAAIAALERLLVAQQVAQQTGGCGLARDPRPVHTVTWVGRNGRRRNTFAVGSDYHIDCPVEVRVIVSEILYFDKVLFGPDHRATFAGPTCPSAQ